MQMIFKLKELAGVCYNRFISNYGNQVKISSWNTYSEPLRTSELLL